jgi:hypothetical protein
VLVNDGRRALADPAFQGQFQLSIHAVTGPECCWVLQFGLPQSRGAGQVG